MEDEKENFILIDKPAGWTSFDVVNVVRKKERKKISDQGGQASGLRVGHAGTLDPFATGLLIIGVGREATKRLDEFKNLPKTYFATVRLGAVSDTDDSTGKIEATKNVKQKTEEEVKNILKKFIGEQTQIPPMYSAKKINGKRLYKLARAGKTVERKQQKIIIYSIQLIGYSWPDLKIEVECSTGTYIRTLAHDIGEALGTGGYCAELRRTKIGDINVKNAEQISIFDKRAKKC